MAFNHYAKMKRILDQEVPSWVVVRINEPTSALNFKGERIAYDHYYRIRRADGTFIKYCKFQKIDKFASVLQMPVEAIPVIDNS